MRGPSAKRRAAPGPRAPRELAVFVRCHGYVIAVPTRWVDRLVLLEEAHFVGSPEQPTPQSPYLGVVLVGARPYAGWDLGLLLEDVPLMTAWVLLQIPYGKGELSLALRTGACQLVDALPSRSTSLPPGLFRARPRAFPALLSTGSLKGQLASARVALQLDPLALWSPRELEASQVAVVSTGITPGSGTKLGRHA